MNTIWSKESDYILKVGRFLEDIGIHNWALTKEQALIAIDKFEVKGIAILGGDVYEMQNEYLEPNYDSWYCDNKNNELKSTFVSRSIAKARDFVRHYNLNRDVELFFTIIPES